MKTLNLKSIALFASVLVLSAGFASCADEPEMPASPELAAIETVGDGPDTTDGQNDAPCTIWWTVDEGVEAVTVNGKVFTGQGCIMVKVGESVSWEAAAKPMYQFTSPEHDTFTVEAGAEGGVICIPITTQKGNL